MSATGHDDHPQPAIITACNLTFGEQEFRVLIQWDDALQYGWVVYRREGTIGRKIAAGSNAEDSLAALRHAMGQIERSDPAARADESPAEGRIDWPSPEGPGTGT